MNNNYFVKLPNNLFIKVNENESLLKQINDDKVVLILDYLYTNTNRKGVSIFVLKEMIEKLGYTYSDKNTQNINKFKDILYKLQLLQVIQSDVEMNKIKPKQYIECILTIDFSNKFMVLYDWEKEIILHQTKTKLNNLKLLVYYCYLKTRIYKRPEGTKLHINTEMAESCHPSFETIYQDLGLSDETIIRYNQVLKELDLIRYKNAGRFYYRKDKLKTKIETPNFYVLFKEGWEEELNSAIKHYKKQNKDTMVFTDEPYKNNDRKANGFIGRIEYLESIGKATEKQIKQKNELINQRKIRTGENDRTLNIQKLFEVYKDRDNILLSEIYEEKGQLNNAKREHDLELELNLINQYGKLLIDYDYYKWVMANYKKEEHTYYLNCVKSHKNTYKNN